jgi:pimeloyl-ACP methyl ester carboxylesterase
MPKIRINGCSLYYELHGQGETIVFVGGFGVDSSFWYPIVDIFKDKYQVLLCDNRGAGQSDTPKDSYTVELLADDVAALCCELGINKMHCVGNSLGGMIVQTLAYRYPELLHTAVISNAPTIAETPFHYYLDAQLALLKASAPLDVLIKASASWVFSYNFLSKPGVMDVIIQTGLNNPHPFTIEGYEGQYSAIKQFDSREWAHKIKVPVLVVGSDSDLIFSEVSVRKLAKQIPNAVYHGFKDCGHLPSVEYPEQFFDVVHGFISEKNK